FWSAYPWVFGETFCVLRTMAAETSTYASILTITAFTVERYVAICHLMLSRTDSSLRRAVKVIVLLWVVSAICAVPMVVQFGLVYVPDDSGSPVPESVTCNIKPDRYLRHAFETSTFLFFVTPMTVITVLYALIGVAIRRSTLSRTSSDTSTQSGPHIGAEARTLQQARARRAVLKMLVAVVVAFFICWAPFHAQRLMVMYLKKSDDPSDIRNVIHHVLYYISGVLYYVSSVINPILYNIMSLKFRQAFKNTI
ncbi:Pyrokinin-1 receptor, partial [Lamellibrachia satsuma]